MVAYNLIPDTPTPKVHYEDVYDLRDAAERIVTDLFAACVRDKPNCLAMRAGTDEQAKLFWDTYARGTVNAGQLDRGDGDVPPPRCCPAIAVAVLPERHALPLRTPESAPDTVPLNAALATKLRVSRSGVGSGRNEQKIGPRGQARRRWLGQRNDPYRDRRGPPSGSRNRLKDGLKSAVMMESRHSPAASAAARSGTGSSSSERGRVPRLLAEKRQKDRR